MLTSVDSFPKNSIDFQPVGGFHCLGHAVSEMLMHSGKALSVSRVFYDHDFSLLLMLSLLNTVWQWRCQIHSFVFVLLKDDEYH